MENDALAAVRPRFDEVYDSVRSLEALLGAMQDVEEGCGPVPPPTTPQNKRRHYLSDLLVLAIRIAREAGERAAQCEALLNGLSMRASGMPRSAP